MRVWEQLEPKQVFEYFEEICSIPHGSGNEKQISDYLVDFAKRHGLRYRQDEVNNVVIWKDATNGYEQSPTVILQGHMDMVAVKEPCCDLDMETEGLRPAISEDGEWVYAEGTSLGGDDGIAVAYALSILAAEDIPHPALEAVFTVDEEVGMLGASSLDTSDLKGRLMLNMDSEDDGIFMVGCAGGARVDCRFPIQLEVKDGIPMLIRISGLSGGHSGEEIYRERANANVLMGRLLYQLHKQIDFSLSEINGGEKDNVIAPSCYAVMLLKEEDIEKLQQVATALMDKIRTEHSYTDPDLKIECNRVTDKRMYRGWSKESQDKVLLLMTQYPNGVQRRMPNLLNMVQTSLNFGILRTEGTEVSMNFLMRSAVDQEKEWLMERIVALTEWFGGRCEISGVYPGWEYRPESMIRDLLVQQYEAISGEKATVKTFHAGVECGLFCEKIPDLDCISYGPEMKDIHSVHERLNIASVKRNYELTLQVLKALKA